MFHRDNTYGPEVENVFGTFCERLVKALYIRRAPNVIAYKIERQFSLMCLQEVVVAESFRPTDDAKNL